MRPVEPSNVYSSEAAKAYLAAIVESSDDAIISKSLDGQITTWNPAAERLFGYTAAEAVGRHITLIIPNDRHEEEYEILRRLKKGEKIDHFETVRRAKDGSVVEISLTVSPIRNEAGEIIGASKIARDISGRKATERALRRLNEKKDEFLASISHELRTPLNAVTGLIRLLASAGPLTDQQRRYVETLSSSANTLMELINDLLDFSRLQQDTLKLEATDFSIRKVIDNAADMFRPKLEEKEIRLNVQYGKGLHEFYVGDPLRLSQVVTNLVANAVKFTERGMVEIRVTGAPGPEPKTTTLTIEVTDTGIGIPEDQQAEIFEKFTQADSSYARRFGGSGLGLAICKQIVGKMGGTISVRSLVGIGSTFTVTLNLRNGTSPEGLKAVGDGEALPAHGAKNILLVEDYPPNALVVTEYLNRLGYDFDVADSGPEALRRFSSGTYDLVLMDVQMPGMDGLETTRRLRKLERERRVNPTPIVALTAHVLEQDKKRCFEAGMDDHIAKPFSVNELTEKIRRHVRRPGGVAQVN